MAIGSVVLLGIIAAPLGIILLGYRLGAVTFHTWLFQSWGPSTYGQVLNFVDNPQPFGFMRAIYLAAGVVGTTALTAATLLTGGMMMAVTMAPPLISRTTASDGAQRRASSRGAGTRRCRRRDRSSWG